MKRIKKNYKKIALAVSVFLIALWSILGTGTSLAWFTDTSEEVKNIFHFADFDLVVSHRLENGDYEEIEMDTKVFDDEAIYEPGYVQIVVLKIENKGEVPFDFKAAVNVTDFTLATNYFGTTFNLQHYLKFGVVTADTEAELDALIADREKAKGYADLPLNNYSTDDAELAPLCESYMALIVRMPEEVDNNANYRGSVIPKVELGVIVEATQKKN